MWRKLWKCIRCFGIPNALPFSILLIRWSIHWVLPACKMRALLGGARHHRAVVGKRPINPSGELQLQTEIKQHSWALLNIIVGKENALHRNFMAVEDSSIRAHPSVALTIPYTDNCGISRQAAYVCRDRQWERVRDRERKTERWEGGQSVTGPSLRPLGPLVMISRRAENTDRMLHQTLPCSPFLPPCPVPHFLPQPLSVNIFEIKP